MAQADSFVQGGNWHIRNADGTVCNLNGPEGVAYVMELLERLEELEREGKRRRRGKPRPSENKHGR